MLRTIDFDLCRPEKIASYDNTFHELGIFGKTVFCVEDTNLRYSGLVQLSRLERDF